jgi:hypothetical protein
MLDREQWDLQLHHKCHATLVEDGPSLICLYQRSPTGGPRENFGDPRRNLDIICNFYVYYTVSLYSDSSSTNITLIILL